MLVVVLPGEAWALVIVAIAAALLAASVVLAIVAEYR